MKLIKFFVKIVLVSILFWILAFPSFSQSNSLSVELDVGFSQNKIQLDENFGKEFGDFVESNSLNLFKRSTGYFSASINYEITDRINASFTYSRRGLVSYFPGPSFEKVASLNDYSIQLGFKQPLAPLLFLEGRVGFGVSYFANFPMGSSSELIYFDDLQNGSSLLVNPPKLVYKEFVEYKVNLIWDCFENNDIQIITLIGKNQPIHGLFGPFGSGEFLESTIHYNRNSGLISRANISLTGESIYLGLGIRYPLLHF